MPRQCLRPLRDKKTGKRCFSLSPTAFYLTEKEKSESINYASLLISSGRWGSGGERYLLFCTNCHVFYKLLFGLEVKEIQNSNNSRFNRRGAVLMSLSSDMSTTIVNHMLLMMSVNTAYTKKQTLQVIHHKVNYQATIYQKMQLLLLLLRFSL